MDIQALIDEYTSWLKSEIKFERFGEYYEITTPFLDSENDGLQIYVRQKGDNIEFTDDCATIQKLKVNGFQMNKPRREFLMRLLYQYNVKLEGDELQSKAPLGRFAQQKHLFLQAMLRVDDMFILSRQKSTSIFLDDVQNFFEQNDIFCSENVQFTGTSGFTHNYDFLIQRTREKPERLCQTVNNANKPTMGNILFSWNDTKPSRRQESELIVILNDRNSIAHGVEDAFETYGTKVIRWSERLSEDNLRLLSA